MPAGDILLLGGTGLVGSTLRRTWADEVVAPGHAELDVLDETALAAWLGQNRANVVVNAVGWADVDGAERERGDTGGRVHALNVDFPRRLAGLCQQLDKHLIHFSTDYVFDGTNAERPYVETDPTHALCWYAETKLRGEQALLSSSASVCVARIEMPFTSSDHPKRDLARTVVARLRAGQSIAGVTDQRITPVFLDDVAQAILRLVETRYTGVIHVAAAGWTTPYDFARSIGRRLGLPEELVQKVTFERFAATRPARRPQHSWLDVSRFEGMFGTGILKSVEAQLDAWAGARQ